MKRFTYLRKVVTRLQEAQKVYNKVICNLDSTWIEFEDADKELRAASTDYYNELI